MKALSLYLAPSSDEIIDALVKKTKQKSGRERVDHSMLYSETQCVNNSLDVPFFCDWETDWCDVNRLVAATKDDAVSKLGSRRRRRCRSNNREFYSWYLMLFTEGKAIE